MGKSFADTNGAAIKSGLEYVKLRDGENEFRLVGQILPRYAYWKKLIVDGNEFTIPVECLSFDREQEKFLNKEKDWFKTYFPGDKPTWSYVATCFEKDGKELKLFGLKKQLYEQIKTASRKLGDPTDPETGWSIKFTKKKNGPLSFNVEYTLLQLELEKAPLTDAQKEIVNENLRPIDEYVPRPTPEEQKEFIERAWIKPQEPTKESNVDSDDVSDLSSDDIPF